MVKRNLVQLANLLIPRAENKKLPTIPNGGTQDIVNEVLSVYRVSQNDLKAFAKHLQGDSLFSTCSNIWFFIKENIRYKEDPEGVQWIKTPARIWQDKECDCKGYSIFTACLLKGLGINGTFRFVSYEKFDQSVTHVYVIVNDGTREIKIDCVMPSFNVEKRYQHKTDYKMTKISRLSGIGCNGDCSCGCKKPGNICLKEGPEILPIIRKSSGPATTTEMTLASAQIPVNLSLTPENLADNLLLLERLKIEMDIESKQDNWNDIRLAMYQEAIGRVKARIELLEKADAKINGGLIKKLLTTGKRAAIDAAFAANPELGNIFLYAYIPNGEVFRNSNTRNLMKDMPAAVQQKALLQQELWNFLENKSQYGYENFGKLTRNAATQSLRKSPEQFLSEFLGIQFKEGERWWYGSSFPIIRGIGGVLSDLNSGTLTVAPPKTNIKAPGMLSNLASLVPGWGGIVSTAINFLKGIFSGKKGVIESAFGIAIPPHLDPALIGPELEKDFGITYEEAGPIPKPDLTPIKKETTAVNAITDLLGGNPLGLPDDEPLPHVYDTERNNPQSGVPASTEEKNNTPLLIGGGLLAAYFLLKK